MSTRARGFSRDKRLTTPAAYQRVFAEPLRSSTASFTALARANGDGVPRVGVVVSRKAAAKAVTRNRVKRLVRESFRRNQTTLAGFDLVILARPSITTKTNDALVAELDVHWSRVARWKKA